MDLSIINNRTRRASIVKEAPLLACDATIPSNRPKWLISHPYRPDTRHNRYVHVTQRYLFSVRGSPIYWCDILVDAPPFGGGGDSRGGSE